MSIQRNSRGRSVSRPADGERRSFSARSLALSLLLGSHPPRLPTATLVRCGELFGIAGGTMRTALSRMADKGEVSAGDDGYTLSGRLIGRQQRQDAGRRSPTGAWSGQWYTVTSVRPTRTVSLRREFRRWAEGLGFGELRPDYWLRPDNIDLDHGVNGGDEHEHRRPTELLVVQGHLDVEDLPALVGRLWPIDQLNAAAARLLDALGELAVEGRLSVGDAWLVDAFAVSAETVRFLMREPRLPPELVAPTWNPGLLRDFYDGFEVRFQSELAEFLARDPSTTPSAPMESSTNPEDGGIPR